MADASGALLVSGDEVIGPAMAIPRALSPHCIPARRAMGATGVISPSLMMTRRDYFFRGAPMNALMLVALDALAAGALAASLVFFAGRCLHARCRLPRGTSLTPRCSPPRALLGTALYVRIIFSRQAAVSIAGRARRPQGSRH